MEIPLTGKPVEYEKDGIVYVFRSPDDETLLLYNAIEHKYPHDARGLLLINGKPLAECSWAELAACEIFNERINLVLIGWRGGDAPFPTDGKPSKQLQIRLKTHLVGWYNGRLFPSLEPADLGGSSRRQNSDSSAFPPNSGAPSTAPAAGESKEDAGAA